MVSVMILMDDFMMSLRFQCLEKTEIPFQCRYAKMAQPPCKGV